MKNDSNDTALLMSGIDAFNAPPLSPPPSTLTNMHPGLGGIDYIHALLNATCKTLVVIDGAVNDQDLVKRVLGARTLPSPVMCVSVSSSRTLLDTCRRHGNLAFFGLPESHVRALRDGTRPTIQKVLIAHEDKTTTANNTIQIRQGHPGDEFIAHCMMTRGNTPIESVQTLWRSVTSTQGKARMECNVSSFVKDNTNNPTLLLAIVASESRKSNWHTALAIAACMANVVTSTHNVHPPILFTNHGDSYKDMLDMVHPGLSKCMLVFPLEDEDGVPLDEHNFSLHRYNHALMSVGWWKKLDGLGVTHAMMVQDDGVLARPCDVMKEFGSKYDYIGAPWIGGEAHMKHVYGLSPPKMGGNGGFSLRNVKAMMHACEAGLALRKTRYIGIPEDVFFSKILSESDSSFDRLPTNEEASTFSSEFAISSLTPPSFGFHKVWAYNTQEDVKKYFDACCAAAASSLDG